MWEERPCKNLSAVARGDLNCVRQILDKKPEEVNDTGDKPKKDPGTVAPSSRYQIRTFRYCTCDRGADLNIEPTQSWIHIDKPVLQTAGGRIYVWLPAHDQNAGMVNMRCIHPQGKADRSFKEVLRKILELGADISQTAMVGLCCKLFAKPEVLPSYYWKTKRAIMSSLRMNYVAKSYLWSLDSFWLASERRFLPIMNSL